eukprot:1608751-Rhodomonas_salina.2
MDGWMECGIEGCSGAGREEGREADRQRTGGYAGNRQASVSSDIGPLSETEHSIVRQHGGQQTRECRRVKE